MVEGLMTQALSPEPLVEELASQIVEARKEHLRQQIHQSTARNVFWLSDIHDCPRYLAYSCIEGEKRRPVDEEVQAKFESGNIWENEVLRELQALRFDVYRHTDSVTVKNRQGETIATGRVDVFIKYKTLIFPGEIKSLDSNVYRQINSIEDLFKKPWLEKYIKQLMMYMYGKDKEQGIFIINDRGGHWKILPLYLDYGYCEKILGHLERTWEFVKRKELPERIDYTPRLCGPCAFAHICLPVEHIKSAVVLDDPEMESLLERHESLKPASREYEEVHKTVVETFSGRQETLVGRFTVVPGRRVRKSYDYKALSEDVRKGIEKETEFWVVDIEENKSAGASD